VRRQNHQHAASRRRRGQVRTAAGGRRIQLELLERRELLYHGPTVLPDGSMVVGLDESLDQFGFQPAMFQAYEGQADFSIFDTGASVVTFSATSQFFFQFFGSDGIPIKVPCGASAEGVGGTLTGHVSQPGTVMADGLHVARLMFDEFGFPVFDINFDPATAAIVPDVQAFVGALIGSQADDGCPSPASEALPTITGTPMLNPTADHPNGLAVNIRPQGELLDFSDFPELNGLVLPVPDVSFHEPGGGVPDDAACTQPNENGSTRDVCTDPVRIVMEFVGFDNHEDPGDSITESYNPVQNHVEVAHGDVVLGDQIFLFDTGAQLSILSTTQAEAFGLDLDNPQAVISVQGAAGAVHDIPGFTIDRLSIPLVGGGTLTFENVPIYVLDVAPGLLDGILGMNLFNNAAAMLYDPFDPAGPNLQLTFFTEHFIDLPDIPGDQMGFLQAFLPAFAATINGGRLPRFDFEDRSAPTVNLSAPTITNDSTPTVVVTARDEEGLRDGTAVALDVDLNGDGDFNDTGELNYTASTLTDGRSQFEATPALAEGFKTLRARVADASGLEGTSASRIMVVDLTPPVLDGMPSDQTLESVIVAGVTATFAMPTATDTIDPQPTLNCTHASGSRFPLGTTTVRCTAADDAGNETSKTFNITVQAPPAGSFDFRAGILTIFGTDQDDSIRLVKVGKALMVQANFGGVTLSGRRSLAGVVVRAGAGNDTVDFSLLARNQNADLDGEAGNDIITSGAGNDVLVGGLGNDRLSGATGFNLLIGGADSDQLLGAKGSDILVGGSLDDSNRAAILAAWRDARRPAARQAVVRQLLDHVLADNAIDILTGGPGIDLFVADLLDQRTDQTADDFAA